jgi:hypothetical protein
MENAFGNALLVDRIVAGHLTSKYLVRGHQVTITQQ